MLAVGMIAQAAAVASFPFLARLVAGTEEDEVDRVTIRSLRTTVAVCSVCSRLCSGPPAVRWSGSHISGGPSMRPPPRW